MLRDYLPVLLQIIVAMIFAGSALIVSIIVGKTGKRTPAKDMAYECGMVPQGEAQPRFSVRFYLIAMLFILFDLEIVFMTPKTSGDSGPGVSHDIFRPIQDSFTTQGFEPEMAPGARDPGFHSRVKRLRPPR